jgi:N-acetylgalactosamine-6-sulfatase
MSTPIITLVTAVWVSAVTPFEGSTQSAGRTGAKPNIVLILADDLGYGDLGCYGCPDIKTPHLDRLARQGVRLKNFYANGPECTPTRAALLTGRYQQRVGGLECALGLGNIGRYDDAIRLRARHDLGLPASEISIARILQALGYKTAIIGKWHLGYELKFRPARHGFEHFFGILGGSADYFHHSEPGGGHVLVRNDAPVKREGYLTDLITQNAVDYIRRVGETPFFLYVPYTAPHNPYQGPNDLKARPVTLKESNQGSRAKYGEMVERLDHGVGNILKALEDAKLSDKTLVIFTSDNGGYTFGRNTPYRGTKGGLFEGGVRVPCIVRRACVLPAGKDSDLVGITMDLTASLARVAGAAAAKDRPFDGVDILHFVEKNQPLPPRTLFWRARRGDRTWWAVRDGDLKYVARKDGARKEEYLFEISRDPGEKNNLLAHRNEDAARLRRLVTAWEKEVQPAATEP